jgi:hypothetical protein
VFGVAYLLCLDVTSAQTLTPSAETKPADQPAPPGAEKQDTAASAQMLSDRVETPLLVLLAALVVIGGAVLLYQAGRAGADPRIMRLGPSFFFWLGMGYTALLLLMATAYNLRSTGPRPMMLGGILPIAVPWFGALGAVTISLEGVFVWNSQWDRKFNYWHIGRPLFGAVLGIVAFFIFVVTVAASGTPPKFLDGDAASTSAKDFIVYYIVAFLVGYREETFRELIKRATDLILKPGSPTPSAPAVTFKVGGVEASEIRCPDVASPANSHVLVAVQNSGSVALVAPALAVTPVAPTPANTFGMASDNVTGGGDLAPGQVKTVEVTFAPAAAQRYSGALTLTATNLTSPKTIPLVGRGV